MRVAILGCGPSGLIAAAGVESAGHEPVIFSRHRKSELFGAQYLHAPIPGIPAEQVDIDYRLVGSAENYRRKVYGDRDIEVSPEYLSHPHKGWDIRATYDALWERFNGCIRDTFLNPFSTADISRKYDVVLSTVPRPILCDNGAHGFTSKAVRAMGDAPERGQAVPFSHCPPNTILCNGDLRVPYYRISNIFGFRTVEWPLSSPPADGLGARVVKPIQHNCDCWDGANVQFLGRYGKWQKGVLSHNSFVEARKAVA